jgi:hypothetical protein
MSPTVPLGAAPARWPCASQDPLPDTQPARPAPQLWSSVHLQVWPRLTCPVGALWDNALTKLT